MQIYKTVLLNDFNKTLREFIISIKKIQKVYIKKDRSKCKVFGFSRQGTLFKLDPSLLNIDIADIKHEFTKLYLEKFLKFIIIQAPSKSFKRPKKFVDQRFIIYLPKFISSDRLQNKHIDIISLPTTIMFFDDSQLDLLDENYNWRNLKNTTHIDFVQGFLTQFVQVYPFIELTKSWDIRTQQTLEISSLRCFRKKKKLNQCLNSFITQRQALTLIKISINLANALDENVEWKNNCKGDLILFDSLCGNNIIKIKNELKFIKRIETAYGLFFTFLLFLILLRLIFIL
ncbi:hypothetical protein TBLA_0C03615 [Henningerozyma blattae CBS 6284]|uniref:Uncharacterized protein n=1 Tax=Henningerozyma blattae (strain ATCC 34711 / CBS 6284 / DSM 70876 / NBRC 10599 / NRRL Y-10934 / UCD 77-7) TaxID=1071380 RepID=I2H1B2_HENB6|nr:hypothetical protein TBLA_0C03615 [Tetrapisispora blattae CBS 6284]CCH60164.1 hypothetical protein TBLA_0C03615 [Tetrapisispora blattae CBS 6284]